MGEEHLGADDGRETMIGIHYMKRNLFSIERK